MKQKKEEDKIISNIKEAKLGDKVVILRQDKIVYVGKITK